jgi:predicted GIY-YIG superfamily endonuclease
VTSELVSRVSQHKRGVFEGFSKTYGCKTLVWYEAHAAMIEAIAREKQIKRWRRAWKLGLIQAENPQLARSVRRMVRGSQGAALVAAAHVMDCIQAGAAGSRLSALSRALRPG